MSGRDGAVRRELRRSQLWAFAGYARRLPGFLRRRVDADESRSWVEESLRARAANFCRILELAVFRNLRSPYRPLFEDAGIELADVVQLVREQGLEGTLGRLYDAGVRVTLDEFKDARLFAGTQPRPLARQASFDNPLLRATLAGTTGGSAGAPRRVLLDLDFLEYQIAYDWLIEAAHTGLRGRPVALWHPALPSLTGLNNALRYAKRGIALERWFSQNGFGAGRGPGREVLLTASTIFASRAWGPSIPRPEYVPLPAASEVARWLARKTRDQAPALLTTTAGGCVRVCLAAHEHELDISGTVFRIGGEPLTPGKARVVDATGCRALVDYSMAEIGRIGIPCGAPHALDDVHLVTDKLALIRRDRAVGRSLQVGALHVTALHPLCPKLMINVETGDYGTLERRECGCVIGDVGLEQHAHTSAATRS